MTPNTEGLTQLGELAVALGLSGAIGIERELRQKSAGLRTHTLVGLGAALFMLISKYGFSDVAIRGVVVLDPSRVAAQIVSGIGFIGGGLIFVRRDAVRGLTTAAAVWVTAAIGAAAGAGLPLLAAAAAAGYFLVVLAFPVLVRRLPLSATAISVLRIRYHDRMGALREVLRHTTGQGFAVAEVSIVSLGVGDARPARRALAGPLVEVTMQIHGRGSVNDLAVELSQVGGVDSVLAGDAGNASE